MSATPCPHPEKYVHRSKRAALKARDALEQARGIDLSLRPYLCSCGAWHLGHRNKRRLPGWARRAGLDQITNPPRKDNT